MRLSSFDQRGDENFWAGYGNEIKMSFTSNFIKIIEAKISIRWIYF